MGEAQKPESPPRVPRVARLLALAIRLEELVQRGEIADDAELARLGRVTRSRMAQIMGLLCLAPDIQEEILFLPSVEKGRDPVTERQLRAVVAEMEWGRKRGVWRKRGRCIPVRLPRTMSRVAEGRSGDLTASLPRHHAKIYDA